MIIGLDLGGTKLAEALFSVDGEILHRDVHELEGRKGNDVGLLISQRLGAVLEQAGSEVEAVGISVPGIYFKDQGTVWAPNIPGWESYPLLPELQNVAGSKVKVVIDSDRACYILGEVWQGAAQGVRDAIFIAVGTGIGAGILTDGKILRGAHDISGAIGWLALDRPYLRKYKNYGCFEYQASGEGIARMARNYLEDDGEYTGILSKKRPGEITSKDVFIAYGQNDRIARQVIRNAVEFWGMTAANLISLFDPDKIIFGGGVFGPAADLIDEIRTEAGKWAQPISFKKVSIEVSALQGDAGLYGTGMLALSALKRQEGSNV